MNTAYISDLDGTLLRSDETLSPFTIDTLQDLAAKGALFSYATARSLVTAKKVTRGLDAHFPVIVYNGAFIMDYATEEILYANYFDAEIIQTLEQLFQCGVYPIVYSFVDGVEKFSFLPEKCTPGMRKFLQSRKGDRRMNPVKDLADLKSGNLFYITCIDTPEKLEPLYQLYKDTYHAVYQRDIYTGEQWLELMPQSASKASGIQKLKELYGIEKIVSFGDGKNDIDMFEQSDEAYAVENADEELKAVATGIIESNENDGVAKWLRANVHPQVVEITDFCAPELDVYARLTEAQLLNRFEPAKGLFIAESPKVILRALDGGCQPVSMLMERKDIDGSAREILRRCPNIPVYTADRELLCGLTGYYLTRGVLCAMRRPSRPQLQELCRNARRIVVLENVQNPTNVGAIFRSAAALGMDAVLLTPGCSDPLYRRSARVSMGTVFQIPWAYTAAWPEEGMQQLQELGFHTAALALTDDSISIDDPALAQAEKLALLLGSEGDGLTQNTIAACDYTVKIPMFHGVDSLNVAAASAVAFYAVSHR